LTFQNSFVFLPVEYFKVNPGRNFMDKRYTLPYLLLLLVFALTGKSLSANENAGTPPNTKGRVLTVREGEKAVVTSGQSVRLLPGTTIEAGGRLIVRITSGRTNGNLHRKPAATKPPDAITRSTQRSVEVIQGYRVTPLPESENINLSSSTLAAVFPSRTQAGGSHEIQFLLSKSNFNSSGNHLFPVQCTLRNLPVSGWGDCPENIRVLRT